jgi:apoptosis-inducing factor 3
VEKTMAQEPSQPNGPDLTQGVALDQFVDGKLAGYVGGDEVLLIHNETGIFAIEAHCTHYNGPLAEGLVTGGSIRCPWHHACFELATGEALRAPALSPVACWRVEQQNGRVFVREKLEQPKPRKSAPAEAIERVVIVGGGAAGFAAAEMLRRRGFAGSIVMLSSDAAAPVDRPNLSKDYLAGTAPEEWVPLRPDSFYREAGIELQLNTEVIRIDCKKRHAVIADGKSFPYDRLLLATGAEPVRLRIPGADLPHVYTLRSLADCGAIIEAAKVAPRALVIGASFIGLEVAPDSSLFM